MDISGVSERVQTAIAAARRSGREAILGIRCADVTQIARSQMCGCLETSSQETCLLVGSRQGWEEVVRNGKRIWGSKSFLTWCSPSPPV